MPDPTDPHYETWMTQHGHEIPEPEPAIVEEPALTNDGDELAWMEIGMSAGAGVILAVMVALAVACVMKMRKGANNNQSDPLVEDNEGQ